MGGWRVGWDVYVREVCLGGGRGGEEALGESSPVEGIATWGVLGALNARYTGYIEVIESRRLFGDCSWVRIEDSLELRERERAFA